MFITIPIRLNNYKAGYMNIKKTILAGVVHNMLSSDPKDRFNCFCMFPLESSSDFIPGFHFTHIRHMPFSAYLFLSHILSTPELNPFVHLPTRVFSLESSLRFGTIYVSISLLTLKVFKSLNKV